MNTREAAEYLKETYNIDVLPSTVQRWLNTGYIRGGKIGGRWNVSRRTIDKAIEGELLPRKVGRRRTFTKEQREAMRNMCERHSLKEVAQHFGCDESYVSLIRRGLR